MPRTHGAKNKPKSDEYLMNALKARGYNVTKDQPQEKPVNDNNPSPETPVKLTIKKTEKRQKETEVKKDSNETVYRCGGCQQVLTGALRQCPYCKIGLLWD